MKIAVVGTGYVGLVTGTCFAELGNQVTCVDIDKAKVQKMKDGKVPIYEPDLETLFQRGIADGRLDFTTNLAEGVKEAEIIFLALPTPPGDDGSADLSYILSVAEQLGKILDHYAVIVDKSTVPVGTAERVKKTISKHAKVLFDVVSNPEFLREGFAVADFMKPDRIVVGSSSEKAKKKMEKLYQPFTRQGAPLLAMDERSAEMTKYAANAFLAAKISFANEIANLCESTGADIDQVRKGMGTDPRIGERFLYAGIGYGGSCFPKDVLALEKTAEENGYDFKLLKTTSQVNARQKKVLVEKVKRYFGKDLHGKVFGVWGLAFKPDTDDIREAASLEIIKSLIQAGAQVKAFDPEAQKNVQQLFANETALLTVEHQYDAVKDADALLIVTEWSEFQNPDVVRLKSDMKQPVIFDGRNMYNLESMRGSGLYYESIGRSIINA